jgi:hypothetical protein
MIPSNINQNNMPRNWSHNANLSNIDHNYFMVINFFNILIERKPTSATSHGPKQHPMAKIDRQHRNLRKWTIC